MSSRSVHMLVPAQRASPFSTRRLHSLPSPSNRDILLGRRLLSSHKSDSSKNSPPSISLWAQIREARPAVRYTVYVGMGLMATAESTFWFNVIRAKYFPPKAVQGKADADQFLRDVRAVVASYRTVWLGNYDRYYSAYAWGLSYGGLNGVFTEGL